LIKSDLEKRKMEQDTPVRAQHALPPLPYRTDALAPHISKETLEYHHGKHHRAYVNKLNELIVGTEFESAELPEIIRRATGPIFNNAAQAWNHTFYWNCLTPGSAGRPAGELARAIDRAFGSFDKFMSEFKSCAGTKFGSGWTWLVKGVDGTLTVRNSDDADNPLRWSQTALLTCDVWEHAYYIDYRNERPKYIDAFWQLVNWEFVGRNFEAAGQSKA
jgi:Fe-Mn family superoxide dismutase